MDETINGEGRVTRSLRKRLTSIDSETSSRPGTPAQSVKLNTINERATASPPRMTRSARQATTPLKTPAKRLSTVVADIVGSAETTSAKRLTRKMASGVEDDNTRRSVGNLSEEQSKTLKRKKKPGPKSKTRDSVEDYDSDVELVQEELLMKKDMKVETCIDLSCDQEENVLGFYVKNSQNSKRGKQNNKEVIDISDDQQELSKGENSPKVKSLTTHMDMKAVKSEIENNSPNSKSDGVKHDLFESSGSEHKNISVDEQQPTEDTIESENKEITNEEEIEKFENSFRGNKTVEVDNTTDVIDTASELVQDQMDNTENAEGTGNEKDIQNTDDVSDNTLQQTLNMKALNELPTMETTNVSLDARSGEARVIEVVEICKPIDISKNDTASIEDLADKDHEKIVLFVNVDRDETPKQVFPKTPVITKTKSYIEMNSSNEDNSFHSSQTSLEKHVAAEEMNERDETISADVRKSGVEFKRNEEEPSPLILKRKTDDTTQMQSSTPIALNNNSTKIIKELTKTSFNLNVLTDEKDDSGNKTTMFLPEKSLPSTDTSSTSPKLYCEHLILETAVSERETENSLAEDAKGKSSEKDREKNANKNQNSSLKWTQPQATGDTKTSGKIDVIDVSIEENPNDKKILEKMEIPTRSDSRQSMALHFPSEEEAEDENELQPNEMIEDEAMEVDNYKSGDSMTSQERREFLENQIPIDGESIGSHTTTDNGENDDDDEEDIDKDDSFIVADGEEEEDIISLESSGDDEHMFESKTKQKKYKRLQYLTDSSSSNENEKGKVVKGREDNSESECASLFLNTEESIQKSSKNSNKSRLSDSAKLSHDSVGQGNEDADDKVETNRSRKKNSNDLSSMEHFNKSLRKVQIRESIDGNGKENTTPVETKKKRCSYPGTLTSIKTHSTSKFSKSLIEYSDSTGSSESIADPVEQDRIKKKMKKANLLGELSGAKEKNQLHESKDQSEKFTGGVDDKEVEEREISNEQMRSDSLEENAYISSRLHPPILATAVVNDIEKSKNPDQIDEDLQELDRMKQMPLGNPLVRTRRQSLVLPSNPNMEISSSTASGGKKKRMSLLPFSNDDFNPSQSFIGSLELRKQQEDTKLSAKYKHLSKSFSTAGDSFENSLVDVDMRRMHKCTKLSSDEGQYEERYIEIVEGSKSSTEPRKSATVDGNSDDGNNKSMLVFKRREEVFKAAEMEEKLTQQEDKQCKQKETTGNSTNSTESHSNANVSNKERNESKEEVKNAVVKALRASVNIILGKKKPLDRSEILAAKRLPISVLETLVAENQANEKKSTKDENEEHCLTKIYTRAGIVAVAPATPIKKRKNALETIDQIEHQANKKKLEQADDAEQHSSKICTSAGVFIETPIIPLKKKKFKTIMTTAGPLTVEPITPTRPILPLRGISFRESPINSWPVGFKVRELFGDVPLANESRKRKMRRKVEESVKVLPKPQWTSSGIFTEEELALPRQISSIGVTKFMVASKKCSEKLRKPVSPNFKERALMRSDVKRISAREMIQRKERSQVKKKY